MDNSTISILDLSDEILLTIFKKLHNVDLLYSLTGINKKLDRVACDSSLTQCVDLTTVPLYGMSDSRMNAIIDRFCTDIFPRIHHSMESLIVQASIFQRILNVNNYPNLRKLTLVNLELTMALQMFNSMLFDLSIFKW
jgi:hypothetical protein